MIGLFSTPENNPKMALSIFSDLDTPLWCIEVFLISIYKKMDTDKIPADEL